VCLYRECRYHWLVSPFLGYPTCVATPKRTLGPKKGLSNSPLLPERFDDPRQGNLKFSFVHLFWLRSQVAVFKAQGDCPLAKSKLLKRTALAEVGVPQPIRLFVLAR